MRRWLLYSGGAIALGVAAVLVAGSLLPQNHVASREALLPASPEQVFEVVEDVARTPEWRPDVSRTEILAEGPRRWKEYSGGDAITYEVADRRPPTLLVTRIADPDLPFGGTWTYELRPEGTGTRLVITERGEVYNPIFRFVSRYVISHTAGIEKYLDDLQRRLR